MRIGILFLIMLLSVVPGLMAGPRASVQPGVVDLGEFEERDVQTREIWLKNTGDEPLAILKVSSTCSCTRIGYNPAPIEPGDSTLLTVIFDGRHRKPGPVRKVFRITTNAETPVTSVLVTGDIIRPFQK